MFGTRDDGQARPLTWRSVALILFIALAARTLCLLRTPLIGTDSSRFLSAAESLEDRDFYSAVQDPYHPMTAYLIAQVNRLQNATLGRPSNVIADQEHRERAAYFVTLFAGLLVVLLMMDLTRRHFPGVPPAICGLLAALQPYLVRSSADIMSDTVFLAFFLLALREGSRVLGGASVFSAISAGGAVGLAYLTRPEALLLLPVFVMVWLLRRPSPGLGFVARTATMVASCALLVVPYVYALHSVYGRWTLTIKKNLPSMLGIETSFLAPTTQVSHANLGISLSLDGLVTIVHRWVTTAPEMLAVATIFGVAVTLWRRQWGIGQTLFAWTMGAQVAVLLLLVTAVGDSGYVSRRHVFILVALSLPFAGCGILAVGNWLLGRILPGRLKHRGGVILMGAMLLAMLPKTLTAQRLDQLAQLEAGRWILENHGKGETIFTSREKVWYYAAGIYRSVLRPPAELLDEIRGERRAWLVFYREEIQKRCPGLLQRVQESPDFRLVLELEEPHSRRLRHLVVYLWEK